MVFIIGYEVNYLPSIEMIKTKSIYDPKEENDGIRILITRYWPRGIKKDHFDNWHKELSPSRDLLKKYKNKEIDFQLFCRLFLEEIKNSNITEICREIVHKNKKEKNITFLCYEKDESICHRKFIKKICARIKLNSFILLID
jgi:uncharacterized protein YeaO (DUF488 family)